VGDTTIYLGDIATVSDGFALQTNVVRQDGRRGVLIQARSVHHYYRTSGGVDWHRIIPVSDAYHLECAGSDGGPHVHGNRHR
jgi:hypothetical protein